MRRKKHLLNKNIVTSIKSINIKDAMKHNNRIILEHQRMFFRKTQAQVQEFWVQI